MKLQTGYRTARWLVTVTMSLAVLTVRGQVHQSNPSQYVAIAEGNIKIDNTVNDQIKSEEKTLAMQTAMSVEWNSIKTWQKKYNSYLKTTRGYADGLKAATTLYAEGVKTLRNLYDLTKAAKANPQGIGATFALNNLYVEVAAEVVKTYSILKNP